MTTETSNTESPYETPDTHAPSAQPEQQLSDMGSAAGGGSSGAIIGMIVLGGFLAGAAGLWFLKGAPDTPVKTPGAGDKYERPTISETGPWPEANVDETDHFFGSMELGEQGEHAYVVTNNGKVDLVVKQGPKSCACTRYDIEKKRLKPGESTKVIVGWKPKEAKAMFRQNMNLYTNDPENKVILLTVSGTVAALVNVIPQGEWDLGNVDEPTGGKASGVLASALTEKVEIESMVASDPSIQFEMKQADGEAIKSLRAADAKELYVTLDKKIPAGPFRGTITFKLKGHPDRDFVINLKGHRDGTVNFQGTGGLFYDKRRSLVDLGQFSATEGKTGRIMLYLSGEHREIEATEVATVPQFMKCTLKKDPVFKSERKSRYILEFEVPAGSPPGGHTANNSGKVTLKTTHPEYPEINLKVHFVSSK